MTIELRDVGYTIGKRPLFRDVSVRFGDAGTYALTGSSGCGKTTLLNILGMLLRPTQGSILVDGQVSRDWNDRQRRRFWKDEAAFIYQDYGIIPGESVLYNITLSHHDQVKTVRKLPRRLREIISEVGVFELVSEKVDVLSGCEKQRVGIARALWKGAKYIFADEPTASLDQANRQLVMNLLFSCAENGAIVTLATHDESLSMQCDKIFNVEEHNANRQRLDVERYLSTLRNSQQ